MDFHKFVQKTDITSLSSSEYETRITELRQIYDELDIRSMNSIQASALIRLYKMGKIDEATEREKKRHG